MSSSIRIVLLGGLLLLSLCGCYQVRSDDDLRTVPVTNNPTIVPKHGGMSQFTSI